ncbi:hypothetical protein V2G26_004492 [Clonostachys chloroleuca]
MATKLHETGPVVGTSARTSVCSPIQNFLLMRLLIGICRVGDVLGGQGTSIFHPRQSLPCCTDQATFNRTRNITGHGNTSFSCISSILILT